MQAKIPNKVEKAATAFDKLYRGCGWLSVNLFFLLFLCWALYLGFVGFRVETNGEIVEGHVSNLEVRDGGTYMAHVEFEVDGQTFTFKDDTAANPPKYELGETVVVRYDRSNPNLAQIDSKLPLWLIPSGSVLALILVLIGVNIWGWRMWKRGEEMVDLL